MTIHTLLMLLLVFCFSSNGFSQKTPPPPQGSAQQLPPKISMEERVKHFNDEIVSKLSLSVDQKTKLNAIAKEFFGQMDQWHKNHPGQKPEKEDFEKYIKPRNEKVKAILSPDQFSKFIELEKKLRTKMQQSPPPPPQH